MQVSQVSENDKAALHSISHPVLQLYGTAFPGQRNAIKSKGEKEPHYHTYMHTKHSRLLNTPPLGHESSIQSPCNQTFSPPLSLTLEWSKQLIGASIMYRPWTPTWHKSPEFQVFFKQIYMTIYRYSQTHLQ